MNKKELRELIKQSIIESKTVKTGGPCICRTRQWQPDGSSKCVKWSPAGCGDKAGRASDTEKDATKKPDSIKLNEAPNCRKGYTTGVEACLANHPSDMGAYDDCYDSVVSTFKKCSGKNWGASNKGRINQFDKNLGE